MPGAAPNLSEDAIAALLGILDQVETEDQAFRLEQLKEFKKHNLFWHGFQYLFWSDKDEDWRIPTHEELYGKDVREETRWIFDYVINHFKAYGEAIIAALSSDIPDVRFGPRNATNPLDVRAVDAADTAVSLIERWNRAKTQVIETLFYFCCEGFAASYTYHRKDASYGETELQNYSDQTMKTGTDSMVCDSCGYQEPVEEENVQLANDLCPQCGQQMSLEQGQQEQVSVPGEANKVPKGREVVEIYGAQSVRVPAHVKKLADAGYLIHYVDADPAVFKDAFPDSADKIGVDPGQSYERLMRQSSISIDAYQLNAQLTTQKRVWFRPWMVERLGPDQVAIKKEIRTAFPSGIYFSVIEKEWLEERSESMDPHWTLTKAGPSKGVHADPLLRSQVPLQEIRNNLANLTLMHVEYGVPVTYADTEVYDFEGQERAESSPGYVYPATARPGQRISDGFFETRPSSLPKEVTQIFSMLDQDEQFVTGAFPSVFGGSGSGSKTLGEYEKSRAYALQRLSLPWYYISVFWGETMHKALISFVEHQIEDEPLTSANPSGGFSTKWVKQADLKGSFERLEPEASSDFPVSFSQKRTVLMALLQLNNPEINQVLFSPENAGIVQSYVGLTELRLPTEIQRQKQMRELNLLVQGAPQETQGPMPGLPGQVLSSVPVEPEIDDHGVHLAVCVDYLSSDAGQDLKEENPAAYSNVLAHAIEHKTTMQQQAMQQAMSMPQPDMGKPGKGAEPAGEPKVEEPQAVGA